MFKQLYTAFAVALILIPLALAPSLLAKPKDPSLPIFILHARTVLVIVDPTAGVSIEDPRANEVARKDVETALLNWGRFSLVMSGMEPDITIVIRKGSGKLANTTISDPPHNNRPGSVTPSDDGVSIGAQHGTPASTSGSTSNRLPGVSSSPHPQVEGGETDDSFLVFEGDSGQSLGGQIGWRYVHKDALHPHNVPAVDEFRKAIAEAEKAAAKQQAKTPPSAQPNSPAPPPNHP
jgi:hypothetical protein